MELDKYGRRLHFNNCDAFSLTFFSINFVCKLLYKRNNDNVLVYVNYAVEGRSQNFFMPPSLCRLQASKPASNHRSIIIITRNCRSEERRRRMKRKRIKPFAFFFFLFTATFTERTKNATFFPPGLYPSRFSLSPGFSDAYGRYHIQRYIPVYC